MLEKLAKALPGLDDLQVYTYDVDAWLCSEFGKCPRCRGIPLPRRLVGFVNTLTSTWRRVNPGGRVWWEPWELSSGQSLRCMETLDPNGLGLVMHCNSAECMATMPVDRWIRNMGTIAEHRGIPVMIQYFLGGTSEETEPFFLSHPLVTLRGLKAIAAVPGLVGIKEYYGLGPDRDDPNLPHDAHFLSQCGDRRGGSTRGTGQTLWQGGRRDDSFLAADKPGDGTVSLGDDVVHSRNRAKSRRSQSFGGHLARHELPHAHLAVFAAYHFHAN